MMYNELDKKGFLQRLGYFNDSFINFMLKRKLTSKYIMTPLLFAVSFLFSLKTIGRISSGKKNIRYFNDNEKIKINFNGLETDGWCIDDRLYAIETPGHTDCHLMYYYRDKKILFTGDALNFLTPNDIQFGDLNITIKSQKLILELAEKEKISMICQGHYTPIADNRNVMEYLSETIKSHEYVYTIIRSRITESKTNLTFDELYKEICSMDDPVIQKLVKITFPRSTLVFLDVYLHKMINEIKLNNRAINK